MNVREDDFVSLPMRKGLVVLGVHSAKFENEKVGHHLGHAIARYNIRHPLCIDSLATMWATLGVTCWPTQLVLGPHGRPVWVVMGEGHGQLMEELIEIMVEHYGDWGEGIINRSSYRDGGEWSGGGKCSAVHWQGEGGGEEGGGQ